MRTAWPPPKQRRPGRPCPALSAGCRAPRRRFARSHRQRAIVGDRGRRRRQPARCDSGSRLSAQSTRHRPSGRRTFGPLADGNARLAIRVPQPDNSGDPAKSEAITEVEVRVDQFAAPSPINFANDVDAGAHQVRLQQRRLPRQGHGAERLQAFAAGLRPGRRLRRDRQAGARAARVSGRSGSLAAADQADRPIAHGGGRRFEADSAACRLLRRWIEQGLPVGKADAPHVVKIRGACRPSGCCRAESQQQLRVVATLSDGATKDVTADAAVSGASSRTWSR